MQIIEKKIADLKPYGRNPRKNEQAVEAVAASIREFGFKVPLVITEKGEVVAGHTRLKAAHEIGLDSVPCVVADDLTPSQIKAFRLADNKVSELAGWDFDMLALELEDITDIAMEQFGFGELASPNMDLDGMFSDAPPKDEEEAKQIKCPHCGQWFTPE